MTAEQILGAISTVGLLIAEIRRALVSPPPDLDIPRTRALLASLENDLGFLKRERSRLEEALARKP